jgi:hypothetical protein
MLGEKRTMQFWRRRRPNFLSLERALTSDGHRVERRSEAEHTMLGQKASQRRFEESKGKIRPAT